MQSITETLTEGHWEFTREGKLRRKFFFSSNYSVLSVTWIQFFGEGDPHKLLQYGWSLVWLCCPHMPCSSGGIVEALFWELSCLNLCLVACKLISTFTASLSICCLKSVVIVVRACRRKTRVNCSSTLLMLMSCRFLKYSLCVPHNSCLPVSIVILVLTTSRLSLLLIAH